MTTTAKRVVVSELQKKVATLKVGEFDVTFNYENKAGEAVTNVQVSAIKGSGFMNYSINGSQTNINFSNMLYDQALLTAVQTEIEDITK